MLTIAYVDLIQNPHFKMILFDNKLSLYYNKDRSQTLDKHSTIFYYSLPAAVEDVADAEPPGPWSWETGRTLAP